MDADKEKPGIQELKQWIALMDYVRSFPDRDGDGIPEIPEKYKARLGRIVKEPSWNPVRLLSRGTTVTWIAIGVLFLTLLVLGWVVSFVLKRMRRPFQRGR